VIPERSEGIWGGVNIKRVIYAFALHEQMPRFFASLRMTTGITT